MTLSECICRKTSKQQSLPDPEGYYQPGLCGFSKLRADKSRAHYIIFPQGHRPEAAVKTKTDSFLPQNPSLLHLMALNWGEKTIEKLHNLSGFTSLGNFQLTGSVRFPEFTVFSSPYKTSLINHPGPVAGMRAIPLMNVPGSDSPPRSLPASSCTRRWLPSCRASPSRKRWHHPPCEEQAESPRSGGRPTSPPSTHPAGGFAKILLPPPLSAGLWGPSQ